MLPIWVTSEIGRNLVAQAASPEIFQGQQEAIVMLQDPVLAKKDGGFRV